MEIALTVRPRYGLRIKLSVGSRWYWRVTRYGDLEEESGCSFEYGPLSYFWLCFGIRLSRKVRPDPIVHSFAKTPPEENPKD